MSALNRKVKNFIVVVLRGNNNVEIIIESDDSFSELEKKWRQLERKYPLPEYDIINARFASLDELKSHLLYCHGWDTVEKEQIIAGRVA